MNVYPTSAGRVHFLRGGVMGSFLLPCGETVHDVSLGHPVLSSPDSPLFFFHSYGTRSQLKVCNALDGCVRTFQDDYEPLWVNETDFALLVVDVRALYRFNDDKGAYLETANAVHAVYSHLHQRAYAMITPDAISAFFNVESGCQSMHEHYTTPRKDAFVVIWSADWVDDHGFVMEFSVDGKHSVCTSSATLAAKIAQLLPPYMILLAGEDGTPGVYDMDLEEVKDVPVTTMSILVKAQGVEVLTGETRTPLPAKKLKA